MNEAQFWTILITAVTTLGAAWLGYWLVGKPRLIVFSPNSSFFQLAPAKQGDPTVAIRAGQVFVQNNGRKSATQLQLAAEPGMLPDGYNLFPTIDHSTRIGSRGEWILEIPFLGPGENVMVQILNGPQIATVRSIEGVAKSVPVIHQRLFPKWVQRAMLMLMIIGSITIAYGLLLIVQRS